MQGYQYVQQQPQQPQHPQHQPQVPNMQQQMMNFKSVLQNRLQGSEELMGYMNDVLNQTVDDVLNACMFIAQQIDVKINMQSMNLLADFVLEQFFAVVPEHGSVIKHHVREPLLVKEYPNYYKNARNNAKQRLENN
ncbi:hypothetical protein PCE1_002060 [Barthelona sp. PCE]